MNNRTTILLAAIIVSVGLVVAAERMKPPRYMIVNLGDGAALRLDGKTGELVECKFEGTFGSMVRVCRPKELSNESGR